MDFFSRLFGKGGRRPRKLKRIKNVTPKVIFDRNGNVVRRPPERTGPGLGRAAAERAAARARDNSYNTAAEPYDFPGDIIRSVRDTARHAHGTLFPGRTKARGRARLSRSQKIAAAAGGVAIAAIAAAVAFNVWVSGFSDTSAAETPTAEESAALAKILDRAYPSERGGSLRPLPYPSSPAKLDVRAGSAILVDAESGCVLYEKDADKVIPPASITKLFVMYIVFKEIESGRIHPEDVVPLPERTWAENLPRDSSLMFLGQGQTVTLDELLAGLAVASGNDAALAVAYYVSGSPDAFVERMNSECRRLGLRHTHFVEPSGYDERNETTARELAEFARLYVTRYPEGIARYHSLKSIAYPLQKNLPAWQKSAGDSKAIRQSNTNPLLGKLDGVDGIKTGFIYESGYNLALTARRGSQRFISITMRGPGRGSKEGNAGRVHDGTVMMEWAFSAFADYRPDGRPRPVPALASEGGRFVNLVPAWTTAIPVPHITGHTAADAAAQVRAEVSAPPCIYGEVEAGKKYGEVRYKLGDVTLSTVPLVAAKGAERSGLWGRFWGTLAEAKLKASM